jgi:transcriptional regulator with XRE-family HTH domain
MSKKTYGSLLKALRKERKLTQVEVAVAVGVERPSWTNIENDVDPASLTILVAAADFFDVSMDWLLQRPGRCESGSGGLNGEREALLLKAFRKMPEKESDLLLKMIAARTADDDKP